MDKTQDALRIATPKAGEKWRLKRDPTRKCLVMSADIESKIERRGYVFIRASWMKNGGSGKSLDTFLKQYERVKP